MAAKNMSAPHWFAVDKVGLGKLIERRGKHWVLAELLQNAWDAPGTTRVDVRIDAVAGAPYADIAVTDDSPDGFADLDHAFTLFAESAKKGNPALRGRFNLGEKLVLALAETASLHTTTGSVTFDPHGRHVNRRRRRDAGSVFEARVRMTREELSSVLATVETYLAPAGILTTINGQCMAPRAVLATVPVALMTEVADESGILRRVRRATELHVHAPRPNASAQLFEMGIPVMDLPDDAYDVDVMQKIPLSIERDGVSPTYLREVRVAVLNAMAGALDSAAVTAGWINDAIESAACDPAAIRTVVTGRFGERALTYDPSDVEANHRAIAQGYAVVAGGSFNANQWEQIRRAGALPAAGRVTPTPRPFSDSGEPAKVALRTPAMSEFARWLEAFGKAMIGSSIEVQFLDDFNAGACYGSRRMTFNVRRLGKKWFEGPLTERQLSLVIHELAHEYAANHLSDAYYSALSDIGARAALMAIGNPGLLQLGDRGVLRPAREEESASVRKEGW